MGPTTCGRPTRSPRVCSACQLTAVHRGSNSGRVLASGPPPKRWLASWRRVARSPLRLKMGAIFWYSACYSSGECTQTEAWFGRACSAPRTAKKCPRRHSVNDNRTTKLAFVWRCLRSLRMSHNRVGIVRLSPLGSCCCDVSSFPSSSTNIRGSCRRLSLPICTPVAILFPFSCHVICHLQFNLVFVVSSPMTGG